MAVLLARGLTNRRIAEELGLSQGRVANLVRSILAALRLDSRTQIAAWAVEQGLTGAQDRLLTLLDRLLRIEAVDLHAALAQVAEALAATLEAEKVDAFLLEPSTSSLVVAGTSDTPMARKQHATGLDRQPLANGGRLVAVFQAGVPYRTDSLDRDRTELPGVVQLLGIRSLLAVPLDVGEERRGLLVASSTTPAAFTEQDLRFLDVVAHWVGLVAYRAERAGRQTRISAAQGRREAVDELVTAVAQDLSAEVGALLALAGSEVQGTGRLARQSEDVRGGLERLQGFVGLLLDAARMEHGAANLAPRRTELEVLVREAVGAVGSDRLAVRIRTTDVAVVADSIRLSQAIGIVLAAVLRHVTPPTTVDVEVDVEDGTDGPMAVVQVMPRLPERPLTELSDPDAVLPPGSPRQPRSTRLALAFYLARRIVEAHGGTLEAAATTAGLGASFRLRLPRPAPHPQDRV